MGKEEKRRVLVNAFFVLETVHASCLRLFAGAGLEYVRTPVRVRSAEPVGGVGPRRGRVAFYGEKFRSLEAAASKWITNRTLVIARPSHFHSPFFSSARVAFLSPSL